MPFGQTGILKKVSVIKTSQQNLRHLRPDVRTVRATTDWSLKGPPSEKKNPTGLTCRNCIDAVRGHICTSHGRGQQKKVLTQREGNQGGQLTFDFNNSDQKVLSKSEVETSAHTFSPSDSGLLIWSLTVEPTVHQASCSWCVWTRNPKNIRGNVCQVHQGQGQNESSQCARIETPPSSRAE